MRDDRALLVAVAVLLLLAPLGAPKVQALQTPPHSGVPVTVPPGTALRPPASADQDTARLLVTGPNRWPVPVALEVWPDTLQFGGLAHLTIVFPHSVDEFAPDSLRCAAAWVELAATGEERDGRGSGLGRTDTGAGGTAASSPTPDGWRAEIPLRIYRVGPFIAVWTSQRGEDTERSSGAATPRRSGLTSAVVQVIGRTVGTDQIAPIREPRTLGWNAVALLAAGVVVLLLALMIRWLWRRHGRLRPVPADRPLAPPPDLAAAVALWELAQAELTARGDEHAYLDRLIKVVRVFLRDRFHLPAGELTATEIVPAGIRLGYPKADLTGYAELIRAGDERRYRPDPIARDICREQMARAIALISRDRCDEVITPVAASLRSAAEQAWVQLQHCYGPAVAAGSSDRAAAGPTGGAR